MILKGDFNMFSKNKAFGGSVISKNIVFGKGRLKWCVREKPLNTVDNGWRFFSNIDTEEFLSDYNNMQIMSWDDIVDIEPAILAIWDFPVGSDLVLTNNGNEKIFYDTNTGERVV